MVVLGLILIALAVLLTLGVGISSGHEALLEVFGVDLDVTAAGVFFGGLITGVTGLLGLWLLKKGTGRTYRRRKEVKELRQQAGETPTTPAVKVEPDPPEVEVEPDGPGPTTTR